jgi:hypothetical protein
MRCLLCNGSWATGQDGQAADWARWASSNAFSGNSELVIFTVFIAHRQIVKAGKNGQLTRKSEN